jgi:hypothetical protein
VLLVIPLLVVAVASALALGRWPVAWAQVLVWVLVLQNVVVIAVWKATGSSSLATGLIYGKEVMIAGGAVVALVAAARMIQARRAPAILWLALAFGVLCAAWAPVAYLIQHEGLEQIARGLRSLVFPVLLLVIGLTVLPGRQAIERLRDTLLWTGVLLGVSAVVERSLVPPEFWTSIGLQQYWIDVKGQSAAMLNGGLPWNFFAVFMGSTIRRAFGIMTDPLGLSYYLLLPLGLAVADLCRARIAGAAPSRLAIAAAVLSAVGITFSLSRVPMAVGALLVLACPLAVIGLGAARRRTALATAAVGVGAFAAVALLAVVSSPYVGPGEVGAAAPLGVGSEGTHLNSLLRALHWEPLVLGSGPGTAGYLSAKFADSATDIGYENVYLDTAAQVGVAGALLMLGMLVVAVRTMWRWRAVLSAFVVPTGMCLALLAAAALLSSQLQVITSLGATWLFAGAVLRALAEEAPQEDGVLERRELAVQAGPSPG